MARTLAQDPLLRRALHLIERFAVQVLKILIIFEQGALLYHFAPDLTNYTASLAASSIMADICCVLTTYQALL